MKSFHRAALAAVIGTGLSAAGCGSPTVTPIVTDSEHEAITTVGVSPEDLASFQLGENDLRASFELQAEMPRVFDRVSANWDSYEEGGSATMEVLVAGTWSPMTIHFQETVDGMTMYGAYVDVPAGSQVLDARVVLEKSPAGVSPTVSDLTLSTFSIGEVMEVGDGLEVITEEEEGELAEEIDGTFGAPLPPIVKRSTWGAKAPRCSGAVHDPFRLTFHHTVTPNNENGATARARMRQIQSSHQNANGWCDIGYHFTVSSNGTIYRGRTTSARLGSHVGGQNTGNVGVALLGSFVSSTPNDTAIIGLARIFAFMADKWSIPANGTAIRGHRQWPGQATSCPGDRLLAKKTRIVNQTRIRK